MQISLVNKLLFTYSCQSPCDIFDRPWGICGASCSNPISVIFCKKGRNQRVGKTDQQKGFPEAFCALLSCASAGLVLSFPLCSIFLQRSFWVEEQHFSSFSPNSSWLRFKGYSDFYTNYSVRDATSSQETHFRGWQNQIRLERFESRRRENACFALCQSTIPGLRANT